MQTRPPAADADRSGNPFSTPLWTALLLSCLAVYMGVWTFDHELWSPDETREGGIVWSAVSGQGLAVPRLNGRPFLEKPPLYYWTAALLHGLRGGPLTAGQTRLPAVLYALASVAAVVFLGRRLWSPAHGLVAGTLLATLPFFFHTAHFALTDLPLTAGVACTLACALGLDGALTRGARGRAAGWAALLAGASALSFYAKGFVGPLLSAAPLVCFYLWRRQPGRLAVPAGIAAAAAVLAIPWLAALDRQGGWALLRVFLVENHWGRFANAALGHREGLWYYPVKFPALFLPWTLLLVPALRRGYGVLRQGPGREAWRFLACWLGVGLAVLSFSASKRGIYLLPLLPPTVLMAADWVLSLSRGGNGRLARGCLWGAALVVAPTPLVLAGIDWNADGWNTAHQGLLLAVAAAGGWGLANLWRSGRETWIPFAAALELALCLLASGLLVPALDGKQSLRPFFDSVRKASGGGDTPLCAFKFGEMKQGAACFYLDRTFPAFDDPAALEAFLARRPGKPVLVMTSDRDIRTLTAAFPDAAVIFTLPQGGGNRHLYALVYCKAR